MGRSQGVRQRVLVPRSGVRILPPQPGRDSTSFPARTREPHEHRRRRPRRRPGNQDALGTAEGGPPPGRSPDGRLGARRPRRAAESTHTVVVVGHGARGRPRRPARRGRGRGAGGAARHRARRPGGARRARPRLRHGDRRLRRHAAAARRAGRADWWPSTRAESRGRPRMRDRGRSTTPAAYGRVRARRRRHRRPGRRGARRVRRGAGHRRVSTPASTSSTAPRWPPRSSGLATDNAQGEIYLTDALAALDGTVAALVGRRPAGGCGRQRHASSWRPARPSSRSACARS